MSQNKKKKSKIGEIAYYLFLIFLVVVAAVTLIGKINNRITFWGRYTTMWILTPSMEPTIPAESYILVRQVDPEEIEVGDVIVFYSDDPALQNNLNTHRVKEIVGGGEEFVTKGDNNKVEDAYTAKAEKVVGVWVQNLPVFSFFGRLFLSKTGIVVVFLLLSVLTSAVYIPEILSGLREDQEKKAKAEMERRIREEVERLKNESPNHDSNPESKA